MSHSRCLFVRRCPACRSLDVRRSHRHSLLEVIFLPIFMLRPFRCEDCGKRHYNLVWTHALPGAVPDDEPAGESAHVRR